MSECCETRGQEHQGTFNMHPSSVEESPSDDNATAKTEVQSVGIEVASAPKEGSGPEEGATGMSLTMKIVIGVVLAVVVIGVAAAVIFFVTQKDSGSDLGIPLLKPPVVDATPTGFKASRRGVCTGAANDPPDCQTEMEIIKSRFFKGSGPQDFTNRLGKVDERMRSLNTRALDSKRACLSAAPTLWNPPAFPGGLQFPLHFQCQEILNSNSRLYFGVNANWAYIAELQNGPNPLPTMAVLAKIKKDSSLVEIWQISSISATESAWYHIKAEKTDNGTVTKQLEVSFATNEVGTSSVGCGMRLMSKSNKIFAHGKYHDGSQNRACSTEPIRSTCADGTTLACYGLCNVTAQCTNAGLKTSTFTVASMADSDASSFSSTAKNLCNKYGDIPALTDFNAQAG